MFFENSYNEFFLDLIVSVWYTMCLCIAISLL